VYTVELYKKDRYATTGERLEHKVYGLGVNGAPRATIELNYQQQYPAPKYRVEVLDQAEDCACYGCVTMRHACVKDTPKVNKCPL
jgi:hypothetical protein